MTYPCCFHSQNVPNEGASLPFLLRCQSIWQRLKVNCDGCNDNDIEQLHNCAACLVFNVQYYFWKHGSLLWTG